MLIKILFAAGLVVVTVFIHAVGFDVLLRAMVRSDALAKSGFRHVIRFVIGLTCWLILIHLVEIFVWGLFYSWQGCFPDAESAFYFPESPTRALATAISCCPSRGGSSHRLRH
jgi:hypothetical protein